MNPELLSFKQDAEKLNFDNYRDLFTLCKKNKLLDNNRNPLTPHNHSGYFVVKKIPLKNKPEKIIKQTFLTKVGLNYLTDIIANKGKLPKPKLPRDYATEITKIKSREERQAALKAVPEYFQELVKKYVVTSFKLKTRNINGK